MSKSYHVAVTGATGVVGSTVIKLLEERNFPVKQLHPFASARSAGKTIEFQGEEIEIQELTEDSLVAPIEIVIFAAGGELSKKLSPIAAENGLIVIDNSSYFRMDEDKKLIVPEINADEITKDDKIIANPNCSTIQSVVPLAAIEEKFGLKRVIYNTYQAVSGAGQAGIADLENDTTNNFLYSINESVLPQIDDFIETGYTKEEQKMIDETRKILADDNLNVTATAVRVPIKNGHAVSINIETEQPFTLEEIRQTLAEMPGIVLADDFKKNIYPLQAEASGTDDIIVGRIRRDESVENGLNLFVVADNIRKGAATNSVQIAESLIKNNII